MSKSAPLPVTVPPTPIAKYSPLALVDQRPAALPVSYTHLTLPTNREV